jgi:TFIIF-interacting CTD phosphatase-like protein
VFREHCLVDGQICIKDLTIFGVDLRNIVLVDNSACCFLRQVDNGIPIIPFTGDAADCQLEGLLKFLINVVSTAKDVRRVL